NAYAGSLAWSNFFSRLTHSHPGRVVWLIFNVVIALLLMELGVFETLEIVLGLYSNIAIAWVGAVVADLIINKPLGLSPSYIEFKRAYLYNFNPVGFGAMAIASGVAIVAFIGAFGNYAQAYSPFIALGLAFVLSPIIALITKGKYYIARENLHCQSTDINSLITCCICEQEYELADTAFCPVYDGPICSLCCSLDAHCHDSCKTSDSSIKNLTNNIYRRILDDKFSPQMGIRVIKFGGIFSLIAGLIGIIIGLVFYQGLLTSPEVPETIHYQIMKIFIVLYAALLVVTGIATWWLVLSEESRELAEEELDKQNQLLQQEIAERQQVEAALQKLTHELEMRVEQRTSELSQALNSLKQAQTQLVQTEKMSSLGQLVAGIAHEINNPINFIHGNLEHASEYVTGLLELVETYETEIPNVSTNIQEFREEIEFDFIQEDLPKLLSSMRVGTERIRAIVLSLRSFSRIDEAEVKAVDLHEGIESTLMIL
ncbi:MAG TPA: histidine kinase dimerization/phospho-acceptor domain-containing protein, partial [Phormidium sp.]